VTDCSFKNKGKMSKPIEVFLRPRRSSTNAEGLGNDKEFTFDHVFETSATQEDVHNQCRSVIDDVLKGYNSTVLAYGQTGSGKTFTMGMRGSITEEENSGGLIGRCMQQLFEQDETELTVGVNLSMVEIYNEQVRDLIKRKSVASASDAVAALQDGADARAVRATDMNAASSRSHALLSLELHLTHADGRVYTPKLQFVDLAGSECAKRTGATHGEQQWEGSKINQSLLALGRVLKALRERATHVPYRDSKLTTMLRDSLGGSARTIMIACISTDACNQAETKSTLQYASLAREVHNRPSLAQDPKQAQICQLKEQLAALQNELQLRDGDGSGEEMAATRAQCASLEEDKAVLLEQIGRLQAEWDVNRTAREAAEAGAAEAAAEGEAARREAAEAAAAVMSLEEQLHSAKAAAHAAEAAAALHAERAAALQAELELERSDRGAAKQPQPQPQPPLQPQVMSGQEGSAPYSPPSAAAEAAEAAAEAARQERAAAAVAVAATTEAAEAEQAVAEAEVAAIGDWLGLGSAEAAEAAAEAVEDARRRAAEARAAEAAAKESVEVATEAKRAAEARAEAEAVAEARHDENEVELAAEVEAEASGDEDDAASDSDEDAPISLAQRLGFADTATSGLWVPAPAAPPAPSAAPRASPPRLVVKLLPPLPSEREIEEMKGWQLKAALSAQGVVPHGRKNDQLREQLASLAAMRSKAPDYHQDVEAAHITADGQLDHGELLAAVDPLKPRTASGANLAGRGVRCGGGRKLGGTRAWAAAGVGELHAVPDASPVRSIR